jgi:DNA (cytosine-5)-methyltransferase 1
MMLTIGSLCSGYGGLDMAVEAFFGARTAWFSEFEAAPSKVLAKHWPGVPNHGDMTRIDWSAVEPVDIIAGGTPCQDLSGAGKRRGMTDGTRSNLWVQMREAVATIRPSIAIWENVRGAFSAYAASDVELEQGLLGETYGPDRPALRALGRVLGDLSDLGYDAQWRGVRAADAGAPHGRFRVFVVAQNTDIAVGDQWRVTTSAETESGRSWADAGRRGGASAADTGRDGFELVSAAHHHDRADALGNIADGRAAASSYAQCSGVERWRAAGNVARPEGTGAGRIRSIERDSSDYCGATDWGAYEPAIRRWEHVLGRGAPSPTETTGKGGAHRLSPKFVEWMMGVPAGWVTDTDTTRAEQLKMLGNGVVPQQATYAFSLLEAI